MIRRLALLPLLYFAMAPLASAQAPDSQPDREALIADVQQLQAENAALRSQIESAKLVAQAQRSAAETQRSASEANLKQAEMAQAASQFTELTGRVDALRAEREVMKLTRGEQMQKLEQELDRLREMEAAIHSKGDSLSAAPEAIQVIAQRMAEAQVENRLAKLEAEAMLEALKQNLTQHVQASLARSKADKLVKQRRDELEKMRESHDRVGLQRLENELREAEALHARAADENVPLMPDIDNRMAETAVALAVSRSMEGAIEKEMSRIQEMLSTGSQFSQVKSQIDLLQKQLMEIKLAASEQEREFQMRQQSEAARMEREVLFPMQIRERVVTNSVGEGHPSVAAIRKEIEIVKKQIAAVRASEGVLDKETERVRDDGK